MRSGRKHNFFPDKTSRLEGVVGTPMKNISVLKIAMIACSICIL